MTRIAVGPRTLWTGSSPRGARHAPRCGRGTYAAGTRRTRLGRQQTPTAAEGPGGLDEGVPTDRLSDVLQVFARFEANGATGRNADFFTCSRVAANAALSGLHLKNAE